MKKSLLILGFLAFQFGNSQVKLSAKAHLAFPSSSSSWKDMQATLGNTFDEKGENKLGFNVGLSSKISLPVNSIFFMPEVYYTEFKNSFTLGKNNTVLEAKTQRIDVPLLVGVDLVKEYFGVFAGPVALFQLNKENWYNDFQETKAKKFALGYQLGAQITIDKLILSGRYEGAFSREERKFINQQTSQEIIYDNSPGVLLLGIGYQF
jgi:hypothetical protein